MKTLVMIFISSIALSASASEVCTVNMYNEIKFHCTNDGDIPEEIKSLKSPVQIIKLLDEIGYELKVQDFTRGTAVFVKH